jgi:hypothetical protein
MFTYRLHSPDGDDLGEATYAAMIHVGEGGHRRQESAVPRLGCRADHGPSVP